MTETKPRSQMTSGEKAWDTRQKNAKKKEAEFKEVTQEEREAPKSDLLEIDDIVVLNMQDLVMYAEKMNIDTYDKTRSDILVELGVTQKKGGKIYVRPQPSAEKLRYLMERNYSIPMNTIFPVEEFDEWCKIVAEAPMAFNGADLSDKKGAIVHTLHAKNACVCGATVNIPNHPETGKPYPIFMCQGIGSTITRKGHVIPVQKCINTSQFRKFIYHRIPEGD